MVTRWTKQTRGVQSPKENRVRSALQWRNLAPGGSKCSDGRHVLLNNQFWRRGYRWQLCGIGEKSGSGSLINRIEIMLEAPARVFRGKGFYLSSVFSQS